MIQPIKSKKTVSVRYEIEFHEILKVYGNEYIEQIFNGYLLEHDFNIAFIGYDTFRLQPVEFRVDYEKLGLPEYASMTYFNMNYNTETMIIEFELLGDVKL